MFTTQISTINLTMSGSFPFVAKFIWLDFTMKLSKRIFIRRRWRCSSGLLCRIVSQIPTFSDKYTISNFSLNAWLWMSFLRCGTKLKLSSNSGSKKCKWGNGGVWRRLCLAGNLRSEGRISVGASGTNVFGLTVKMFSHLIYYAKDIL